MTVKVEKTQDSVIFKERFLQTLEVTMKVIYVRYEKKQRSLKEVALQDETHVAFSNVTPHKDNLFDLNRASVTQCYSNSNVKIDLFLRHK